MNLIQNLLRVSPEADERRLLQAAAQLVLGFTGLAIVTFVCFQLSVGVVRTGFAFVILISLVSLLGSFTVSCFLSIAAVACLDYFFAPPLFQFGNYVQDDVERIVAFLTTSLVVTALTAKLKRAASALRENRTRWEKAERMAHFGWWERDFTSKHVSLSDEVSRIFGMRPVDLPDWHRRWLDLIHPDDRAKAAEAAIAALNPGGPQYDVEYRVVRADGTVRMVRSQGDVTWDRSGKPLRQFGVLHDITELRQTERDLRVSEARFRTFVDQATDAFFLLDDRSIVLDVNQQACDALGYGRAELIGKHRRDFDAGLDDAAISELKKNLARGAPVTFETVHRRKDGSTFPVEVRVGQFEQGGRRFMCVVRDITERKRTEEALKRSAAYLAEAQRLSHTGTSVFNAHGSLYWSEECYRIWELDVRCGLPDGRRVLERVHPEDRDRVREQIRKDLRQKRERALEFRIVGRDGAIKFIETNSYPLFSAQGDIIEVVATHVDVTERRRAQEQVEKLQQLESDLAHMQRLGIMGELTASLAHEILHPIATARNNARAGMRLLDADPRNIGEVREALACVVRDADHARDIVGRIRDHIRKSHPRKETFDFNEAVSEVIAMVRNTIERNSVLARTSLMEEKAIVCGDRVQLQQVTLNLILNAVEAMASVTEGVRELVVSTEPGEAGGTLVCVRDWGPGIQPDEMERVFEPFYTTKISGIGIGLSICRSIVDAHGGRLWAEACFRGAAFKFTLPPASESSAARGVGEVHVEVLAARTADSQV
ncbi:PAS domain S-box protein [Bradyrhizobium sp. DASA03120]|uniref:PAS domain S-box protein n=1 Tax=Bradyrhizobium sp. SMVTL-02 TaxID=3395917 RepID=UPI003F715D2B